MNKQIVVIGLIISIFGAYLFSISSVTVLSEFDNIPVNSFITYYANVTTYPLPFIDYRLELTNNIKGPEYVDGELIEGDIIHLFLFDPENYDVFKRCGGSRQGDEICKEWKPMVERYNVTGTYKKLLDPETEQITAVVWNKDKTKIVQNSISIRLESSYSGLAALTLIIGLLTFYIGISSETKIKQKKIIKKTNNVRNKWTTDEDYW